MDGNTTVDLGTGNDQLDLASGANILSIFNTETVQTSNSASDTLTLENGFGAGGTTFADLGGGSDTLNLANANNTIFATGFEVINGGTGDDVIDISSDSVGTTITGANGSDTFTLGSGSDILNYTSAANSDGSTFTDVVNGFNAANDMIDVSSFNAVTVISNGFFQGDFASDSFLGGGEASALFDNTTDTLKIDSSGSGTEDMEIVLNGVSDTDLSDINFIFANVLS